jgi:subtilisin family serine protease
LRQDSAAPSSSPDFNAPLALLGVPQAERAALSGQNVWIAVFDTGFELSHPALSHIRVQATYDFINGDQDVGFAETSLESCFGQLGCDSSYKQLHHGTAVLSLIAGLDPESGTRIGPAPSATFFLAKTENNFSETVIEEDNWVAAMEWADSLGADIISASLGYLTFDDGVGDHEPFHDLDGRTTVVARAASVAASRGILVCTAAGNNGPAQTSLVSPADADSILAVGAVDLNRGTAAFSSRGPTSDGRIKPDLVAPGVALWAANHGYSTGNLYTSFSGTSAATPLIAGLAALVLESAPHSSTETLRNALLQSADRAELLGSDLAEDNTRGWGIPDFCRASPGYRPGGSADASTELRIRSFPQPFTADVQFVIDSPFDDRVRVTVYDSAGAPLRSLGPVSVPAGQDFSSCDLRWDGRNEAGEKAAGGIYFVVARSANGSARTILARTP